VATDTPQNPAPVRVPISVYVLWHPDFADGPQLANAVYDWLGPSSPDLRHVGMGIGVYNRSEDWDASFALSPDPIPEDTELSDVVAQADHAARARIRREVDVTGADINLLIPLVDAHMLLDRSWQRDLARWGAMHRTDDRVCLAPVQLVPSLESLGPDVADIQPIRIDSWRDPDGEVRTPERLAQHIFRLRREVVQLILRLTGSARTPDGAWPVQPLRRVFLSHASSDREHGPGVAEALRDAGRSYGHIETFYDANDLRPGESGWAFQRRMASAHGEGFVAILSDRYARRTWTREELSRARTPRLEGEPIAGVHIWTVRPTVAVSTLDQQWSRVPDDLATVPVIRYEPGREREVFDRLLRESMVQSHQLQWAHKVAREWAFQSGTQPFTDVHVVTWTPNRPTLAALRAEARRLDAWPGVPGRRALVVYPGFGFFPGEEARLERDFGSEMKLRSFAEVLSPTQPGAYTGTRVWLSASDASARERAARGYDAGSSPRTHGGPDRSSRHVDNAVLRILRRMLPHTDLAYGGALRGESNGFQDLLLDLLSDRRLLTTRPPGTRPLTAFSAWPGDGATDPGTRARTTAIRAERARVCRFYDIPEPNTPGDLHPGWRAALALSHLRRVAAQHTDLTLCAGGRETHYSGLLPGILEEVLTSLLASVGLLDDFTTRIPKGPRPAWRNGIPDPDPIRDRLRALTPADISVVLLGEFGGATRLLVQAIEADLGAPLPPLLTFAHQLDHPDNQAHLAPLLAQRDAARRFVDHCYDLLEAAIHGLRRIARMDSTTPLPAAGLTVGAWRRLMASASVSEMSSLLARLHPIPAGDSRRVPEPDPLALPTRLVHALAHTLADGLPGRADLELAFPGALEADDQALSRALDNPDTRAVASALHHHIGVHTPALWTLLAHQRPDGADSVRAAFEAFDIPLDTIWKLKRLHAARRGRLGVHLVWHDTDPHAAPLVARLTGLLTTLGDSQDAPGEGIDVRHWSYAEWPPAEPRWDDFEDNVVVLMWRLDHPLWSEATFANSAWVDRLLTRGPRVVQAVHMPATRVDPPPDGFESQGYRELLWSTDAPAESPVGTEADVLSAVLWAVTLSLRPVPGLTPVRPERARLAFVMDRRPDARVHPELAHHFDRRRCVIRQSGTAPASCSARADDPLATDAPLFDVDIVDDRALAIADPSGKPRVVVGHRQALVADARLAGPGRLTVQVHRDDPASVMLASHLLVARQRWLHSALRRVADRFHGWRARTSTTLLGLCALANHETRPVLVPEPAPSPTDRAALTALGVDLPIHSPTSAAGPVLGHWTVTLVCLAPSSTRQTRAGLPPGATERVAHVLTHILEGAGARVERCHTPAEVLAKRLGPTQQAFVLVGLPSALHADDPWLGAARTLVRTHDFPVYPLGVLDGAYSRHDASVTLHWPAAWTELGNRNGLGADQTEQLAHTADIWEAGRQLLDGAGHLLRGSQ